jgi:hypothetical protein
VYRVALGRGERELVRVVAEQPLLAVRLPDRQREALVRRVVSRKVGGARRHDDQPLLQEARLALAHLDHLRAHTGR